MGTFGALIKELRLKAGLSLREYCSRNGFDAGNHSKLERGKFAAPESDERVAIYAHSLGLREGSDDWMSLFDAAAAERGRIPGDLMSDEELAGKLPLLFRTIRSEQKAGVDLDDLIERIKRS